MQQETTPIKKNASISVPINVFFYWVPQAKLYQTTKDEYKQVAYNEKPTSNHAKLWLSLRNCCILLRITQVIIFLIQKTTPYCRL